MKLYSLKIAGLRRLQSASVRFGDATFLIGANNTGKSTVFKAIDLLLSANKAVSSSEYFSVTDPDTNETKPAVTTIVIEGEFRNLPPDAEEWRGFKGRIFKYTPETETDTGLAVTYRKTYEFGKDVVVELRSKQRTLLAQFSACKTAADLIASGASEARVKEIFEDPAIKLSISKGAERLEQLDEVWEVGEGETWFANPGGIPGNVLKMLPRFLLIPADTSAKELEGGGSGVLAKTLGELFEDVRSASANYEKAQEFLNALAKELDPDDKTSEFGKMLEELNTVLLGVFPESKLHAKTLLSDAKTAIKPTFAVEMSSNIRTLVSHQGSGMVRAAAFGILRFRQRWLSRREDAHKRALIVCFEEPEIYLHPSAANQMRNTIYELSGDESQIVATTHSPYLIDLSRKPKQVLNSLRSTATGVTVRPFSVSDAFQALQGDDQSHVKMILRVDDYVARVFFTRHVVIVEGDTEEVVIRETLKLLPKDQYLAVITNFEVIKARGKASIIGLCKYLVSMGIDPIVVHDRDLGVAGAEVFNQPIANAAGANGKVIQMHECVEDVLGYPAPTAEKPFRAFQQTATWAGDWVNVPEPWKAKIRTIFDPYVTV
jgi:putative ATP-dependent endonuclease of the OLD family